MMLRGRLTPLTSSLMTSCSVALSGAEYVMSRSMHSSTVYFGSPRVYRTNSSEKFSWTSVMGNRSLKTRSRPMSSRSCEAASSWSSASKARVWMSRRWGIAIPLLSSFPNEISFINSGMSHPQAGKTAVAPTAPRKRAGTGASRRAASVVLPCNESDARRRRGEGQDRRATGAAEASDDAIRGPRPAASLLHVDDCALLFELGLDRRCFVLRHAGLHGLGRAIDQVLRFLQAEARDLTDDLDDLDLLRAGFLEHDRELGLLFGRRRTATRTGTSRRRAAHRGGRDRDVELALESLDEVGELEHRHVADRLEDLVLAHGRVSHCGSLLKCSQVYPGACWSGVRLGIMRLRAGSAARRARLQTSSAAHSSRRGRRRGGTAAPLRARPASARAAASPPAASPARRRSTNYRACPPSRWGAGR